MNSNEKQKISKEIYSQIRYGYISRFKKKKLEGYENLLLLTKSERRACSPHIERCRAIWSHPSLKLFQAN